MAITKPMEIAFDDVKHIIIDILLVECHCVLYSIWVIDCPKYIFLNPEGLFRQDAPTSKRRRFIV